MAHCDARRPVIRRGHGHSTINYFSRSMARRSASLRHLTGRVRRLNHLRQPEAYRSKGGDMKRCCARSRERRASSHRSGNCSDRVGRGLARGHGRFLHRTSSPKPRARGRQPAPPAPARRGGGRDGARAVPQAQSWACRAADLLKDDARVEIELAAVQDGEQGRGVRRENSRSCRPGRRPPALASGIKFGKWWERN